MKHLLLAALCCIFLGHQTSAQTNNYNSLLWEISGNGLSKPSYLYGTMHVSEKLAFHLGDPFFNAIQSSDAIALEVNPTTWLDDMLNSAYYKEGMRNNGDFRNAYSREKTVYPFMYKMDRVEDFKTMLSEDPALLNGLMFRMTYGMEDFEEDTYLDMYIYKTAMKKGKEVYGIQTLDALIRASIDADIDRVTRKPSTKKRNYDFDANYSSRDRIEDAYRSQNLDLLDSLSNINADESFQDFILYKRNVIMADFIDSVVKSKTLFTGVGAAHLPGEKGIIELLRAKGYTLKPIQKGERNASTREKLDNTILPLKMNTYKSSDGIVSFVAPNKIHEINDNGIGNAYLASDLVNGVWYLCSRHAHFRGLDFKSTDDIRKDLKEYVYEYVPGKIISQKTVMIDGNEAISIINQTRKGDYQRILLMITSDEMVMFKAGGIKDVKKDLMGAAFINSIHYTKPALEKWQTFNYFTGEFSVKMPTTPICYKTPKDTLLLGGTPFIHSYDDESKTNYLLQRARGQMFLYIETDSNILNDILMSGQDPVKTTPLYKQFSTYKDMNCVYAGYKNKNNEYIHMMALVHDLDRYLLSIITKDSTFKDTKFFSSLSIHEPYAFAKFSPIVDTNLYFTSVIPYHESELVTDAYEAKKRKRKDRNRADVLNDEKILIPNNFSGYLAVDFLQYPKYYSMKDTGAYLKDQREKITRENDLVVVSEKISKKGKDFLRQDFVLRDTASQMASYITVLLDKNIRYTLFGQCDANKPNKFITKFFDNFTPIDSLIKGNSIFADNSELWYADAKSSDSLTKENAFELLGMLQPKPGDSKKLISAFENDVPQTDDYLERRVNLIQKMGSTGDTSCIGFLNTIYKKYSDTSIYQFAVLHALVKINAPKANTAFSDLIKMELPLSEEEDIIANLMYEICDSSKNKKDLIPAIVNIAGNEDYKPPLYYLLTSFLDSNIITPKAYESIKATLISDGKTALKKHLSGDNKDNVDQGNNHIYHIAKLLAPFYSDEAVQLFFQKGVMQNYDKLLKADFAIIMMKNKLKLEDSIHQQLMAEKFIRPYYYTQLKAEKLPIKIDSSLMQIDSIALCMFYYQNGDRYDELDSVTLIKKVYMNALVNSGYIYFYKFKEKDEENASWEYAYVGSINATKPEYLESNNTDYRAKYLGFKEEDTPAELDTKINNTLLKMARRENIKNHSYTELFEKEDAYLIRLTSYGRSNYDYDYDYDY